MNMRDDNMFEHTISIFDPEYMRDVEIDDFKESVARMFRIGKTMDDGATVRLFVKVKPKIIYDKPRDTFQLRLDYSDAEMEVIDKLLVEYGRWKSRGMDYQRLVEIGDENDLLWLRRVIYDAMKSYTKTLDRLDDDMADAMYTMNGTFIDKTAE